MGLAVTGLEPLDRDVRIYLGGRGRGMAENLLDAAQVSAAFEEVSRGAVADAVRPGVARGSSLTQALVHDPAGSARIQPAAADAQERQEAGPLATVARARRPAGASGSRAQGGQPDRHGRSLSPLPVTRTVLRP